MTSHFELISHKTAHGGTGRRGGDDRIRSGRDTTYNYLYNVNRSGPSGLYLLLAVPPKIMSRVRSTSRPVGSGEDAWGIWYRSEDVS